MFASLGALSIAPNMAVGACTGATGGSLSYHPETMAHRLRLHFRPRNGLFKVAYAYWRSLFISPIQPLALVRPQALQHPLGAALEAEVDALLSGIGRLSSRTLSTPPLQAHLWIGKDFDPKRCRCAYVRATRVTTSE
jgi:hypothetical protein